LLLILPVVAIAAVGLIVGMAYQPEFRPQYLAIGAGLALVLSVIGWLAVRRLRQGQLTAWQRTLALALGGIAAASGAGGMIIDDGDWVITVWILLLGLALFWIALKREV
jgi:hypothetical protein